MPRWRWLMAQVVRRLWVRATLIGSAGVLAALLAAVAECYLPWTVPGAISTDALDSILTVIASSMLSVTTFSLNVMVSSYGSATSNVTPRATKLLIEDRVTQTVLSTFLGSFLFGLVVSKTGAYGESGRTILFVVTIAVIVLIVVALLRWIDHLTRLGRVGETTDRVETAARTAIEARLRDPYLGGRPLRDPDRRIPAGAAAVTVDAIGYVQHIDMAALSKIGEAHDIEIFVAATPGRFVHPETPVAWIGRPEAGEDRDTLRRTVGEAFLVGNERACDQDPRFGLAVMSEIGSRALSPATNDPGTAIDVIGRSTRLVSLWVRGTTAPEAGEPKHPRIHVPPLDTADMFEDAFMLMARDGAGLIEVQLRIQKALLALSRIGGEASRAAALHQSRMALERAELALTLEADKIRRRPAPSKPPMRARPEGGARHGLAPSRRLLLRTPHPRAARRAICHKLSGMIHTLRRCP